MVQISLKYIEELAAKYRRHPYFFVGVAAVLLLLSIPLYFILDTKQPLIKVAQKVQHELKEWEKDFNTVANNKDLLLHLANNKFTQAELSDLMGKPYFIFLYSNEELVFWNSSEILPTHDLAFSSPDDYVSLRQLSNGYYQIIQRVIPAGTLSAHELRIIALQLIRYDYGIQNKYLVNKPNPILSLEDNLSLSPDKGEDITTEYYPLSSDFDKSFFYLYYSKENTSRPIWTTIILQSFAFFFLLLWLYRYSVNTGKKHGYVYGFVTFAVVLFVFRAVLLLMGLPLSLSNHWLLRPENYQTLPILYSPGELAISLIFALFISVYLYRHIQIPSSWSKLSNSAKIGIFSIASLIVYFIYIGLYTIIRATVLDFNIDFAFNAFNYINSLEFFGLFYLAIGFIVFYCYYIKLGVLLETFKLSASAKFVGSLPSVICVLLFYMFSMPTIAVSLYFLLIAAGLYLLLCYNTIWLLKSHDFLTIKRFIFWQFLFTLLAALYITDLISYKRQQVATHLYDTVKKQQDPLTEFYFKDVARKIMTEDEVVRRYFTNYLMPERDLVDRIRKSIMGAHFDKYDIKVYAYDSLYVPIRSSNELISLEEFENKISRRSNRTKNNYLYTSVSPFTGTYTYLCKLPIFPPGDEAFAPIGYLVMELTPKADVQPNVYPELTIEDRFRQPNDFEEYSYAIYLDEKLDNHNGLFSYRLELPQSFKTIDTTSRRYWVSDGYFHLFKSAVIESGGYKTFGADSAEFKVNNNIRQTVVISHRKQGLMDFLSLFSYLFMFSVIAMIAISFLHTILKYRNFSAAYHEMVHATLRKRINFSIVLVLLVSFSLIAGITVSYFYNRSAEQYKERLLQKQKEILAAFEEKLQARKFDEYAKNILDRDDLYQIVTSLSEIHGIDINIFDHKGILKSCSQPGIFDKSLVGKIINPHAYQAFMYLHQSQYMQNEEVGELSYLSSYIPIKDDINNIIGFLNIPYFAKEKELRREISSFLVALLNVYVLLLLVSGMLAIYLSNSITQPLALIGQKLRGIKLGQKNEPLEWEFNDELGALVRQYNQMLDDLESAAERLASTERQQAWQQMARQVAHEIKNPLTPMKLSIQHLQRAFKENRPNIKEMTERVTQTLVEQIDALSQIASEFSNFAKMPKAVNEILDIREVVNNVVNLLESTPDINLYKRTPHEECWVYADKNQLIRVFNNLIKNAIQAIPDDRQGVIVVNCKRTTSWIIVAVTDNGSGIPTDMKEKVFLPNFTTKNSGMGLGLAMTRNIIEAAYGKIWFESVENEGTTFFVKLPYYNG